MPTFIFFNNKLHNYSKGMTLKISEGIFSGDGLFSTLKIENGFCYNLAPHLKKLFFAAEQLNLSYPQIDLDLFYDLIQSEQFQEGTWRLKISLYRSSLNLVVLSFYPYSEELKKYSLDIYPTPVESPLSTFKTLNNLNRIYLLEKARERDLNDWLLKDSKGHFLETSICNIFWIKDKILYTPNKTLPLYFGCTIELVIKVAKEMGYEIVYAKEKKLSGLLGSHVFVTNSLKDIVPVDQIGYQKFEINKKLTEELFNGYLKAIYSKDSLQATI